MTVAVNLASYMSGAYVRDIQDALGRGASVAVTVGAQGSDSVTITGTPTGEGLKIEAKALQVGAKPKASAYDTISLSPAAQAALDQQKIALTLLVQGQQKHDGKTESQKAPETASTVQQSKQSADASIDSADTSTAVDANDVTALSQEDPTQLVKELVGAEDTVAAQLSTAQGFMAAAALDPSFLQTFAKGMPDDLGSSFLAAAANGTLDIQSGKDLGGGLGSGVMISGYGESSIAASNATDALGSNMSFDFKTTNYIISALGLRNMPCLVGRRPTQNWPIQRPPSGVS